MLKKVGAVAGAVAIIVCWPFATGKVGESAYFDALAHEHSPYVTISNVSYHRSYASSDIVTKVVVNPKYQSLWQEEGLPTTWQIDSVMNHGFFSVKSQSTLDINKDVQAFVTKTWGQDVTTPVVLDTKTSLFGNTEFHFQMSPVNLQDQVGTFKAERLLLTGTASREGFVDATLMLPSAEYQHNQEGTVIFKAIDGHVTGQSKNGFWIGKQSFSLGKMAWSELQNSTPMTLTDFRVSMNNTLSESEKDSAGQSTPLLTNKNDVHIGQLDGVNGQSFSNLNFVFSVKDLNYDAVNQLNALSSSVEGSMTAEEMQQVSAALNAFVKSGAALHISTLSVDTPEGKVSGNGVLRLAASNTVDTQNILSVLKQLGGNISLSVPKALIDTNPSWVANMKPLLKQGIIEQDGNNYTLNVIIKGDTLILSSGARLPISLLFMMMM